MGVPLPSCYYLPHMDGPCILIASPPPCCSLNNTLAPRTHTYIPHIHGRDLPHTLSIPTDHHLYPGFTPRTRCYHTFVLPHLVWTLPHIAPQFTYLLNLPHYRTHCLHNIVVPPHIVPGTYPHLVNPICYPGSWITPFSLPTHCPLHR